MEDTVDVLTILSWRLEKESEFGVGERARKNMVHQP